jgi:UDP-N-acetylglucosamine--N-acetylmuramyl-(pentapeptide) pyrophosphoryl-undecaprenol N-acetylglucosamine transferase
MTNGARSVLIMAGGTGGHIFPGLALAKHLEQQGVHVEWLGAPASLEAKLVPERGLRFHTIAVRGLRGKGIVSLLTAPFMLLRSIMQARAVLSRVKPAVVVSFGGFVAGPGGVAARFAGIPLVVHEANRIPGFTNKVLSKIAAKTLAGFPDSFATKAIDYVGNPVRQEINAIGEPAQRLNGRSGPLRVLVIGGSLGAQALNQVVPFALAAIDEYSRPDVRHQCGLKHAQATQEAYREAGLSERAVQPFISDMAEAYAWADVVICRAGALTLAELAVAGVFALLVPFPFAVDDHQTHNARFLVERGAAELRPQNDLTAEWLAHWLQQLTRERCLQGAVAARAAAKRDALEMCANAVMAAAKVAA